MQLHQGRSLVLDHRSLTILLFSSGFKVPDFMFSFVMNASRSISFRLAIDVLPPFKVSLSAFNMIRLFSLTKCQEY